MEGMNGYSLPGHTWASPSSPIDRCVCPMVQRSFPADSDELGGVKERFCDLHSFLLADDSEFCLSRR